MTELVLCPIDRIGGESFIAAATHLQVKTKQTGESQNEYSTKQRVGGFPRRQS